MAVSGFTSLSRSRAQLRAGLRLRPRRRLRPLRRWFLASVRARTTALSMLVVAAALAVCAISLVVIISRSLVRNVDETNLTRAEDVAARARAGAPRRIRARSRAVSTTNEKGLVRKSSAPVSSASASLSSPSLAVSMRIGVQWPASRRAEHTL